MSKKLKVTYIRSAIGFDKKQRTVLKGLGLNKLNSSNVLPDNACVRGAITKVRHLLRVEEVEE